MYHIIFSLYFVQCHKQSVIQFEHLSDVATFLRMFIEPDAICKISNVTLIRRYIDFVHDPEIVSLNDIIPHAEEYFNKGLYYDLKA